MNMHDSHTGIYIYIEGIVRFTNVDANANHLALSYLGPNLHAMSLVWVARLGKSVKGFQPK